MARSGCRFLVCFDCTVDGLAGSPAIRNAASPGAGENSPWSATRAFAFQPLDKIGIETHRDRPLAGPVHLAYRAAKLFFSELGNIGDINCAIRERGQVVEYFLTLFVSKPSHAFCTREK